MSEKFSLKWNDFQSNVSRTFSQLRSEEEFFDVSLVSDDQKMVSAHKLVLSASSPYFKHILTTNKHSHPLLCLDGVSSAELQCVLDYIYQGEVQIYQEQLDRFLEVAQRLQLEGLTSQDDDQERKVKEKIEDAEIYFENNLETSKGSVATPQIKRSKSEYQQNERRRPRQSASSTVALAGSFTDLNTEEIDQKIEEYLVRAEDGTYSCGVCGKAGENTRNRRQHMKNHVETHMEGLSFPCQSCDKTFRSRHALACHKSKYHTRNSDITEELF